MKKVIALMLILVIAMSALAMNVSAYGMGGTSIYNSSGTKIGSGSLWDEPNSSPLTLGGEMTSYSNSTLTVVLKPRGIDLSTGATNVLIAVSPKSKSNTTYVSHTYDVDPSQYYPTLAAATFIINGIYSADYSYSGGWNWGY